MYMYEHMYIAVHTERCTGQLPRTKREMREMLQRTHTFLRASPIFLSLLSYIARALSLSSLAAYIYINIKIYINIYIYGQMGATATRARQDLIVKQGVNQLVN